MDYNSFKQTYLKEAEEKENVGKTFLAISGGMFLASAQVHVNHIKTKSGFKHEVLDKLYDELQDWGDTIAEKAIGFGMVSADDYIERPYNLENPEDPIQDTIEILEHYIDELSRTLEKNTNKGMDSVVTDIIADMGEYLYKLKHFEGK